MPRFYLNVHDNAEFPDLHGTELEDLDAARDESVRLTADLLQKDKQRFWTAKTWSMEVCDDAGLVLFTLTFAAGEMPSVQAVPYKGRG